MGHAIPEYLAARSGPYAWMLGRFIVRFSQAEKLLAAVPDSECVEVSAILDRGAGDMPWLSRMREETRVIRIGAIEAAVPAQDIAAFANALDENNLRSLPCYVETEAPALRGLSELRLGAKIRCGGLTAQSYPSTQAVATFIHDACTARVPFKATAGLHHPIRHFNEAAGVTMHGFLNLLAASAVARSGAGFPEIHEAVQCEDPSRFELSGDGLRFDDAVFDTPFLRSVRAENFIAYGSCSFAEPAADLRAMGVLA